MKLNSIPLFSKFERKQRCILKGLSFELQVLVIIEEQQIIDTKIGICSK